MADTDLGEIGKIGASVAGVGGVVFLLTQVAGGLLRGWISGATGQEKEVREDLRVEVKRLSESLTQTRNEVDGLRLQVRTLSEFNLHVIVSRAEARAALNAHERLGNLPLTVWPPDPSPTGGTP